MTQTKGCIAEAARTLGLPAQTLFNWVKGARKGSLLQAARFGRTMSAKVVTRAIRHSVALHSFKPTGHRRDVAPRPHQPTPCHGISETA